MTGPRTEGILSWDEYFMLTAMAMSLRSKDPNRQVGAVVVNPKNRIIGTGYNGPVTGIDPEEIPWDKDGDFDRTKYPWVCHAERNAIYSCYSIPEKSKIYCTLFPCNVCAMTIRQKEIQEVIFLSDSCKKEALVAKDMFNRVKIKYRPFRIDPVRMDQISQSLLKMIESAVII